MSRKLLSKFSSIGEKLNRKKSKTSDDIKRMMYRAAMLGLREITTLIESTRSAAMKRLLASQGFLVNIKKDIKFDHITIKWPKEKDDET